MSKFAAALFGLFLSVVTATAQTDDELKRAMGEVAGELQQCSVFFRIASSCVSTQNPALARDYEKMARKVADLAISSGRDAGVSDEAYAALNSLETEAMANAMRRNCTNIAVLLNKYSKFCQRLSQDADPRLKEWIACARSRQPTCGGPVLP